MQAGADAEQMTWGNYINSSPEPENCKIFTLFAGTWIVERDGEKRKDVKRIGHCAW
jgi:hypothetical protein